MDRIRELISRRIAELGLSMAAISRECGRNDAYIQQYLTRKSPRFLPEDVRATLVTILKVNPSELNIRDLILPINNPNDQNDTGILVVGEVAAGVWREQEADTEPDEYLYGLVRDPRFPRDSQFALKIKGDSCNLFAADGDYAICVNALDIGRAPKNGDFVIVVRRRMCGQIHETTCKQVEINGVGMKLWPRSTNEKHQTPLLMAEDGEDAHTEIEITAFVISFHKRVL